MSIAIKHRVSERNLRKINELYDDRLDVGEVLLIPVRDEQESAGIAVVAQNPNFKITTQVAVKSPQNAAAEVSFAGLELRDKESDKEDVVAVKEGASVPDDADKGPDAEGVDVVPTIVEEAK